MPLYWIIDSRAGLVSAVAEGDVSLSDAMAFLRTLSGAKVVGYRKLFDGYNERLALGGLDTLPFFPVLERKDFDVRASGPIVMEALYPIPGTQQNIGAFVDQAELVMTRLRPLLLDPALQKTLTIYILADNSD